MLFNACNLFSPFDDFLSVFFQLIQSFHTYRPLGLITSKKVQLEVFLSVYFRIVHLVFVVFVIFIRQIKSDPFPSTIQVGKIISLHFCLFIFLTIILLLVVGSRFSSLLRIDVNIIKPQRLHGAPFQWNLWNSFNECMMLG